MCAFVTDSTSPDEVSIRPKESPSEAIFIRRFIPYTDQYAKICTPHKHDFYHFMFFAKGSGEYTIDFVKFDIKPGTAYFMIPGQVHNYAMADETHIYLVNFSETYFQSFLRDAQYFERFPFFLGNINDSVVKLKDELQGKIVQLFDNMIEESHHHREMGGDMIKLWLLEALMLIAAQCKEKGIKKEFSQKRNTMISSFKKLVDEHFVRLSLPKDYAALLFVTPSYLNQLSQKTLGKTAGEVIRDRKLLEAKRMLVSQDLNISQISHDLNFADPSHFSKFFKKYTRSSPEDFRKKYLVNVAAA